MANNNVNDITYEHVITADTANSLMIQYERGKAAPMDITDVFETVGGAKNYAASGNNSYVGKILSVIGGNKVDVYKIDKNSNIKRLVDEEDILNATTSVSAITSISATTAKSALTVTSRVPSASTSYSATTSVSAITANKVGKSLNVGAKSYDGSSEVTITLPDLGLETALKYHGKTNTPLYDGATTNPIKINNKDHFQSAGCVVIYESQASGSTEFVWSGSKWEKLGDGINYKVKQIAVSDPAANGSALTFIDTISQDTNGVIKATKKLIPSGTTAVMGVVKLVSGDLCDVSYKDGEAAAGEHFHSQYSPTGHTHNASAITEGTFDTGRIPTGITVSKAISATRTSFLEPYENILDASSNDNISKGYFCYVNPDPNVGDKNVPRAGVLTSFRDSHGCATQFLSDYKYDDLYYRSAKSDTSSIGKAWTDWHKIAYIDSKVNSASTADSAQTVYTEVKNNEDNYYLIGVLDGNNTYSTLYKNINVYMKNGSLYASSDERLKDFVKDIDVDLDILSKLPKKYFTWKNDEAKQLQIGTSAQKVYEIYPELVSEDKEGKLAVSYEKLSVVALAAVDKLYEENKELKERLKKIEEHLGL